MDNSQKQKRDKSVDQKQEGQRSFSFQKKLSLKVIIIIHFNLIKKTPVF